MKIYVTFGQDHVHYHKGVKYDKDCVGVIEAVSEDAARRALFHVLGRKFCFTYPEDHWEAYQMRHFKGGYKPLDLGEYYV